MTVEEIFSQLVAHAIEGLMVHAQMAEYYDFLGLKGYEKCHEYHYFSESCNYRNMCEYYIRHFNKLPMELPFNDPKIIPETWYKYNRLDVDAATRKSSVIAGMTKWVDWETKTKHLYEQMYIELMALNQVAAALEVKKYIECTDDELASAYQKHIDRKAIDYDISSIMNEQDELYKKYKKKLKEIELC